MKKIILILCTPLLLYSQEKLDFNNPNYNQIQWNSNFLFESNGLNKNFLNTMLYGGHITDSLKNNWINLGDDRNNFYSEISNSLSYKNSQYNIGLSIADRNIINASFSDDLMRLAFYGNFNYQNETLDFSNTNIRADRFQQYKLDYTLNFNTTSITIGGSFLAGNHHASFIVNNGSLFTDTNGIRLDANYDIYSFVTDTSSFDPFARNGSGLAFDLSTDFSIRNHKVTIYLQDAGFIMWNSKSITLITDTNISFSGTEITDIMSFNDSLLNNYNTIDDLKTKNKSIKTYIPANFGFSVMKPSSLEYFETISAGFNAKWQPYSDNSPLSFAKLGQGIRESNYAPLYWVSAVSKLKYFNALPTLSYGGYSNDFNLGLSLSKGEKNKLTIGTQHLEDVFTGDKAKAVSVYFNIKLQF
jgi:hypothetical protein